MRTQKWLFHLTNIAKSNPAEMLRYTKERLTIARGKMMRRRDVAAIEMGLQEEDLRLLDIDPILFYAATHYEPAPYSGRVLMVQAAETPNGQHWQMEQQWRQPLVGKSVVHCVAGGMRGCSNILRRDAGCRDEAEFRANGRRGQNKVQRRPFQRGAPRSQWIG